MESFAALDNGIQHMIVAAVVVVALCLCGVVYYGLESLLATIRVALRGYPPTEPPEPPLCRDAQVLHEFRLGLEALLEHANGDVAIVLGSYAEACRRVGVEVPDEEVGR